LGVKEAASTWQSPPDVTLPRSLIKISIYLNGRTKNWCVCFKWWSTFWWRPASSVSELSHMQVHAWGNYFVYSRSDGPMGTVRICLWIIMQVDHAHINIIIMWYIHMAGTDRWHHAHLSIVTNSTTLSCIYAHIFFIAMDNMHHIN